MKTSTTITNIAVALLKAQTVMGAASKGSSNPYFKSKYADFNSVLEACKEALNSNGITILQPHDGTMVETILLHTSGEYISSTTNIVVAKQNDPQAYGSAITYARRYGLQSLVSLPAEDDDGEGAMIRTKRGEDNENQRNEVKDFSTKVNAKLNAKQARASTEPSQGDSQPSNTTLIATIRAAAQVIIKQSRKTEEEIVAIKNKYGKVLEEMPLDKLQQLKSEFEGILNVRH